MRITTQSRATNLRKKADKRVKQSLEWADAEDMRRIAACLERNQVNKALELADDLDTDVRDMVQPQLRGLKYTGRQELSWFGSRE